MKTPPHRTTASARQWPLAGSLLLAAVLALCSRGAVAADKLIEIIPDNAAAAVYIQRPQRALPPDVVQPLFEALTGRKTLATRIAEAVKRVPGPLLIGAILPPPNAKQDPVLLVAMESTGPQMDMDDLVEKTFLPVIEGLAELPPGHRFVVEKGQTGSRILRQPGGETVFAYAVKGRIAFGSTKPQLALRWARGRWPPRRWVDVPGVRRMIRGLPKTASVRVLVNPVSLLKHIEKPSPNSPGELALKVLAPQDVQASAIDLSWEKAALSARLTIALADECEGIARVLARPTNSARLLGVFPEGFVAVGRIGWGRASDLVDGAYALCDRFDETISAEYREELAEFREQTGVTWDTGILGNLVGEMAFGVRVDFTRKPPIGWATVFPLADAAGFRKQLDKLIAHFGLTFDEEDRDGTAVRTATGTTPFSMAVEHGLLIVGDSGGTVAEIAKQAAQGKRSEPVGDNLRRCYAALGDPNHVAVMLDIERLRKRVPILPVVVGPKFAPLLAEGSIGAAMTVEERVARVDFRWFFSSAGGRERKAQASPVAGSTGPEAMVTLTQALAASFARARLLSKRTVSATNMRGIGQALYIYAQKHKGTFPDSLEALVRAMPDTVALTQLTSPYDGRGPTSIDEVQGKSYLIYRPGLTTKSPPLEILLAERELSQGQGANFLFVDSHVEFIREPRASELLELLAEGAEEIRK